MSKLSDEQIEQAAIAGCYMNAPWDDLLGQTRDRVRRNLRKAAPFLQMPWDEPTEEEFTQLLTGVHPNSNYGGTIMDALKKFVHIRNAALLPKPVDPRREAVAKVLTEHKVWTVDDQVDRILAALDKVKA